MSRSAPNSIATIDQFISSVGAVKTASDGSTPKSEPGSIGGETTHPVKKVDDRLKDVKTGDRFSENTKDVNEDQGAPGVQKAPEASTKSAASIFGVAAGFAKKAEGGAVSTPGSAADDHKAVTTTVSATGEDPSNETNSAKAGKEDKEQGGMGGTSHPASTENDQLDGHKYASDTPLEKLAGDMQKIGNNLLAAIHHTYTNQGQQPPVQTKQAAAANPQQHQQPISDPNLAFFAGHELAGLISGNFDKRAADEMVHNTLTGVIKQASDDADLFITYASNFLKRAEGEEEAGGGGGEEAAGGGGDPMAAAGGGGGGGGGGGEEEMMAALGGGAGGGDPSGGAGGGDPMAAAGGGGDEAAQLAQILEQLGVTPEELEQALQQQGMGGGGGDPSGGMGGMGGGGAGGMGGGDPMAAMAGGAGGGGGGAPGGGMPGMETQANAGGGKRNANANTIKQAEVRNYIQEIVSRSRARK